MPHRKVGTDAAEFVAVVVELRDDDIVAPLDDVRSEGARQVKRERGGVRPEGDLPRLTPEQIRGGGAPLCHELEGAFGGDVRAPEVGIGAGEVVCHGGRNGARDLTAARAVAKYRCWVDRSQRREVAPSPVRVKVVGGGSEGVERP